MTTWVDTNVLVALWSGDAEARVEARKAMKEAAEDGWFAVGACVYAEFLAGPAARLVRFGGSWMMRKFRSDGRPARTFGCWLRRVLPHTPRGDERMEVSKSVSLRTF